MQFNSVRLHNMRYSLTLCICYQKQQALTRIQYHYTVQSYIILPFAGTCPEFSGEHIQQDDLVDDVIDMDNV